MNRYRVLSRIGFGTFGEVYQAKDLSTGEIVALKTVARNKKQKEKTTDFQRELNSLLKLKHPNV